MWQRAQTLYIFLATVLVGSLFFCEITDGSRYTEYPPYLILTIIASLLNLIALTTFKVRILQVRTVVFAALITLALQGWLAVDFLASRGTVFKLSAVFPLAAVILDVLAARGIWADELLVRNAGRLRAARRKNSLKNNNAK